MNNILQKVLLSILITLLTLLNISCAGNSYLNFVKSLNDRQLNSCAKGKLSLSSNAPMVGGRTDIIVITATGGAKVENCNNILEGIKDE